MLTIISTFWMERAATAPDSGWAVGVKNEQWNAWKMDHDS